MGEPLYRLDNGAVAVTIVQGRSYWHCFPSIPKSPQLLDARASGHFLPNPHKLLPLSHGPLPQKSSKTHPYSQIQAERTDENRL